MNAYFKFCQAQNITLTLPVDTISAANFLASLREKQASKHTIRLALVSLKWLNSFFPGCSGTNDPLEDNFLTKIVDSAKRNIFSEKKQKLPFSKEMITSMMDVGRNPTLTQIRDALIPSLSFSLMLRNDELIHISCLHMVLENSGMKFQIVSSKTDVYRNGKTVFLAKQNKVFNLLTLYMRNADLHCGQNKFLFGNIDTLNGTQTLNGSKRISYKLCLEIVKQKTRDLGRDPNLYGTHSSRSGAATSLAHELSPFELMVTGRWADARSLGSYVEMDDERRYEISRKMFT